MIYEYVVGCDERGFDWLNKVCKQTNSSIILKKKNYFLTKCYQTYVRTIPHEIHVYISADGYLKS